MEREARRSRRTTTTTTTTTPPPEPVERTGQSRIEIIVSDGLADRQFRAIMEDFHEMSEHINASLEALNAEIADTRASFVLALEKFQGNLTAAQEANAALQAQIDTLVADAVVSQGTIDSLTAQNATVAASIDEATGTLNTTVDELAEDHSGENA